MSSLILPVVHRNGATGVTVCPDDDVTVASFADWLDLLRVLETFIETARRTSDTGLGD
ncbi:MAG: hypothetical protein ABI658_28125 [Acidimicrobiales bacterium]